MCISVNITSFNIEVHVYAYHGTGHQKVNVKLQMCNTKKLPPTPDNTLHKKEGSVAEA